MFAFKFKEPKKYTTELRGSFLRHIKTIRHRNFLELSLEVMEEKKEDIKKAVPKLSNKEIDTVMYSRDMIEFHADERNSVSQFIDDGHEKRKLLKEKLEKVQPNYKKAKELNQGFAQKYGNEIDKIREEIEYKRNLRMDHIDKKLLNLAIKINGIFENKGYKSTKRNDENFFWVKTIYKKETKETKEKYEEQKKLFVSPDMKKFKRQLR